MQTLFLDGREYTSPLDLHMSLKRLLSLPDYYGMNADALHDVLSERTEPVNLYIRNFGEGSVEKALRIVCQVVEDLGGTVRASV
ncbi:MAG: barstar family protein [Clostridia bacterium]|nr:barstar family protein [Clostridia bacterium]